MGFSKSNPIIGMGSFSKNELKEIIALTNQAKKRLVDLTEETDVDDKAADSLEEALDSLDDAVDLMEDALENGE